MRFRNQDSKCRKGCQTSGIESCLLYVVRIPYYVLGITASCFPLMPDTESLFFTISPERTRPFLSRLEALRLRYIRRLRGWGRGAHISQYAGAGMEFREFRDYAQGDDIRNIDWKTSARFDKPYVRTFQQDESRFSHFFLDTSRSMVKVPEDRKLDVARDIAVSLGYLALCSEDSANFSTSPRTAETPPNFTCQNRARVMEVRDYLSASKGGGMLNLPAAASEILQESRGRHGTVVLLSDFLFLEEAYRRAVRMLVSHGLQVAVIQVIGQSETGLPEIGEEVVQVSDSETGERKRIQVTAGTRRLYRQAMGTHQQRLQSFCYSMRVWYASFVLPEADHENALEEFVLRQLPGMGFLRGKV